MTHRHQTDHSRSRELTMTHIIYANLGMNIWVSFRIRIWKYCSNMFYQ
jgi:hypothetical protein